MWFDRPCTTVYTFPNFLESEIFLWDLHPLTPQTSLISVPFPITQVHYTGPPGSEPRFSVLGSNPCSPSVTGDLTGNSL